MAFFVIEGKPTYSAILMRDWIHTTQCVPSTLHQKVMIWNENQVEMVEAEADPAMKIHPAEAFYYSSDVYPLSMMLEDAGTIWRQWQTGPVVHSCRSTARQADRDIPEPPDYDQDEEDVHSPIRRAAQPLEVQDPLKEINWGMMQPLGRHGYPVWVSKFVPVVKKNRKICMCFDFRNLNLATPNDEYVMQIANMLVDSTASGSKLKKISKAIKNLGPPHNIKELQNLIGKVNFLRRFIAKAAGKMKAFSMLLRGIKTYLSENQPGKKP
ncbi:uncharacterized protein LOC127265990 [Andrographis paniculata]|uniref:uncharacterized protein LOC127265990 n=1 Tax=Andrographis paniculata TaxID=175694 RepID=UPI0021E79C35|nr:uncharacterized protein LOC127265990 [Andrographis paniculata]